MCIRDRLNGYFKYHLTFNKIISPTKCFHLKELDSMSLPLISFLFYYIFGRYFCNGTVSRATGISENTIKKGCDELENGKSSSDDKIRVPGGGRKKSVDKDPTLLSDLETLVEPTSRGDPESPLLWTCKSLRNLAKELQNMGHKVSHARVADMLHMLGYSLQANKKTIEGTEHPDR